MVQQELLVPLLRPSGFGGDDGPQRAPLLRRPPGQIWNKTQDHGEAGKRSLLARWEMVWIQIEPSAELRDSGPFHGLGIAAEVAGKKVAKVYAIESAKLEPYTPDAFAAASASSAFSASPGDGAFISVS